jgi:hypothetical protein
MDTQLEQRIRERAYELWMQHGSLPGRADEYWYQAEQEILGQEPEEVASTSSLPLLGSDDDAPVEVSAAPLGMTSETMDEILTSPVTKTRKRRSSVPIVAAEPGEVVAVAPKRKRTVKTT